MILGIDPGLTGGVAWVSKDDTGVIPMPILNKRVNLDILSGLIADKRPRYAVIESVSSARAGGKQIAGTASLVTGINYGLLLGLLHAHGVPFEEVTPMKWKKEMGLVIGKDADTKAKKEASIQKALNLFPFVDLRRTVRSGYSDGMAEALLIAEYGRRKL